MAADCFGHFPSSTQAPKGPELCRMKRPASREGSAASTHFNAALPESTAAPLSKLFDQQALLCIHKLTPPDLRSLRAHIHLRRGI